MASHGANEYWVYNQQHQRYSRNVYDFSQQTWAFANWEPIGFLPPAPQHPRPHPPPTTTTPHQMQPTYSQVYDERQRSDSTLFPGQGAKSAAPETTGYPVSYSTIGKRSYDPATPGSSSIQASPWQNPSSAYGSSQQYLTSAYSMHPQPEPSMTGIPTSNPTLRAMPRGRGQSVNGTWKPGRGSRKEEKIDTSYMVRDRKFFHEGRVFSVKMNEMAGTTASASNTGPDATDYNSSKSINAVRYKDNYVYANVRRFIVVRAKREFCYAIPIFTYSGRATTKRGVRPSEHGIAFSWGREAQLLPGEGGITKPSIAVVMAKDVPDLNKASRIYYGIMHPIQYNVKAKEIGYVPQTYMPALIGNWKAEEENDTSQPAYITESAEIDEEDEEEENEEGKESEGEFGEDLAEDFEEETRKGRLERGSYYEGASTWGSKSHNLSNMSLQVTTSYQKATISPSIHRTSSFELPPVVPETHQESNASDDIAPPGDAAILSFPNDSQPERQEHHDNELIIDEALLSDVEHNQSGNDDDMSLFQLFQNARHGFENAIAKKSGWAWQREIMVTKRISDLSCRLNGWYESIRWLITQSLAHATDAPSESDKDNRIDAFFTDISQKNPSLSSNVFSYLDDIVDQLETVKTLQESQAVGDYAVSNEIELDILDTAMKCLCLQLEPIAVFARKHSKDESSSGVSDAKENIAPCG